MFMEALTDLWNSLLWDVAQGETIRHYTGHHKAVICVALHDRPASE